MNQAKTPINRLERKARIRALLFFTLALIAGAFAVFVVKVYLDRASTATARVAEPVPLTDVVIAARDIPIGTRLEAQHLALVPWPEEHAPTGGFSSAAQVVGRSTERSLVSGELILAGRLADPERGSGIGAILEDGSRAMAVKVDQVVGVAGFVQPGDHVDVITTMKPDDETRAALESETARISKIILQNIRVLAIGEHLSTEGHKPMAVQVVTLEVQPEQAEKLALGSQHGEIQLTMRSRIDQLDVPTAGVTPLVLLSPDEGSDLAEEEKAREAREARERQQQARQRRRARVTRKPEPEPEPIQVEAAPEKPVVEILRGTRGVEKRTLRRSADAE